MAFIVKNGGILVQLACEDCCKASDTALLMQEKIKMMGGMLSIFSEEMSLGLKAGLTGDQILDVVIAEAILNPIFKGKGSMLLEENDTTSLSLKHM